MCCVAALQPADAAGAGDSESEDEKDELRDIEDVRFAVLWLRSPVAPFDR